VLVQYMSGMLGIGVCAIIFSQLCSSQFILLLYSEVWATPSTAKFMRAYCVYLMFMAMNGMAEAFAYGLANQTVLNKLQAMLVFNSVLYVGAVVVFSGTYGIIGLTYANCLNMGIRSIMSLKFSID